MSSVIEFDKEEDKKAWTWWRSACVCVRAQQYVWGRFRVCVSACVGIDTKQIKNWSVCHLMNRSQSLTRAYVFPHACTHTDTHTHTFLPLKLCYMSDLTLYCSPGHIRISDKKCMEMFWAFHTTFYAVWFISWCLITEHTLTQHFSNLEPFTSNSLLLLFPHLGLEFCFCGFCWVKV